MRAKTEPIVFQKKRHFGEVLGATFKFIRQEFKPFFKVILFIAGPFILIASVLMGFVASDTVMSPVFSPGMLDVGSFFIGYILIVLLGLLATAILITTLYSYIKLYIENGPSPEVGDVWMMVRSKFLGVLGSWILLSIMIIVGTFFLIVPGIYMMVSFSLFFIPHIIEDKTFSNSLRRSYKITHTGWWWTFLVLIVSSLIASIISRIFTLPQSIYQLIYTFNFIEDGPNDQFLLINSILLSLAYLFSFLINFIPFLAITFHYYGLVEKKEHHSLISQIKEIETEVETINEKDLKIE